MEMVEFPKITLKEARGEDRYVLGMGRKYSSCHQGKRYKRIHLYMAIFVIRPTIESVRRYGRRSFGYIGKVYQQFNGGHFTKKLFEEEGLF
jgi:hypothetical protein